MKFHHRFPIDAADCADIKSAIRNYILPDLISTAPPFKRDRHIIGMGSCFAGNVVTALLEKQIPALHLRHNEYTETPTATDTFLREIFEGGIGSDKIRNTFRLAQAFIMTVGVAVSPFLDGKPVVQLKPDIARHVTWGLLSIPMITESMQGVIRRVRAVNPDIAFILTVSPLPLQAAMGTRSVFTQDCVSKSLLRVATQLVMDEKIANVWYWPSFEMVRWLTPHVGQFFGINGADNRHVDPTVIGTITDLFIETYFEAKTPGP